MAVQKTLALISKFKINENHEEQASISPIMRFPEPVQQAPIHAAYDKDLAIQNILKTIREKHNLPPSGVVAKKAIVAPKHVAVAPKKQKSQSVSQEV